MNSDLIEKIQHDFDRIALLNPKLWDHNNHYHSFLLDRLPKQGNIVLEIGCGTGKLSRLLAKRFKPTEEEIEAWQQHGITDEYLTLTKAKTIYTNFLEKVKIRKHLFWRYSVVWQKPLLPA